MMRGHERAESRDSIGFVRSILPVRPAQAVSSAATACTLLLIWVLLDWLSSTHSYKGSLITPGTRVSAFYLPSSFGAGFFMA